MPDMQTPPDHPHPVIMVVMPARDESLALPELVPDIPSCVDRVIIVDNGSVDNTACVARDLGADVLQIPEPGYGRACLAGSHHAIELGADIIVFLDADRSDFPDQIERLIAPISGGRADMVIGSRVLGRRENGALSLQQRFGNSLACFLIRQIWKYRYTDLGPFRAVRASALASMEMSEMTYGWTVEMQIKALQDGLHVQEVPTDYRHRIGTSKISGTVKGVVLAGYCILRVIAILGFRKSNISSSSYAAPVTYRSD